MGMIYGSISYTTSGRKKKSTTSRKNRRADIQRSFARSSIKPTTTYRRPTPDYPSADDSGMGIAAKKESPKYTGTLVKGIGTMHKSNAIPIIDEEQMKDIARMRR